MSGHVENRVDGRLWVGVLEHPGPWTEEEFLALPEDCQLELLDGNLLSKGAVSTLHQRVRRELANSLDAAAPDRLLVVGAVNVRVGPACVLIPDVVVAHCREDFLVVDATEVLLVAEVVSPSTVRIDRVLKPHLYAAAGIEWYLRVEVEAAEPPEVIAYQLSDGAYAERARAQAGQTLRVSVPFELEVDLGALLREHAHGDSVRER